jgi:hypothetical protein
MKKKGYNYLASTSFKPNIPAKSTSRKHNTNYGIVFTLTSEHNCGISLHMYGVPVHVIVGSAVWETMF